MIVRKAVLGVIGLTALVVCVTIALVSGGAALYLALAPALGAAAAAALVFMFFFLLILALVILVNMSGQEKESAPDEGLLVNLFHIAKERPLLSAAAAVAAAVIVVRNPAMVATIVAALADRMKPGR